MVPEAVEAAAGCLDVMLDGEVRRGADVVRLRALGGSFAFVGRAPLYDLAASGGQRGCDTALGILVAQASCRFPRQASGYRTPA
jgi:isopentenyl diphosphate isomerase/L-lactate dehydrogenase-like FMN-dependent dehydrogenase